LLSRLDNKKEDSIVVVMQRLHVDDLVGHLLNEGGWIHLDLPAIAEAEESIELSDYHTHSRAAGEPLHPARDPMSVLEAFKRSMGSMDFSAQYQQRPIVVGGNLIKWNWFKFYDQLPSCNATDRIVLSWDTAMSSKELACYSACVVLRIRGETVHVLDVFRERLDYPDLKRKVIELHERWRFAANDYALLIENKGSGMSLIQDLAQENIHAIAVDPVGDKVMRMNQQSARIEAGSVWLPRQEPWLEEFRHEVMAFPAARYSDQVDALSQGLNRAFDRSGGEFSWGAVRC
jgi:predicted phage terminase large subunit-like protein